MSNNKHGTDQNTVLRTNTFQFVEPFLSGLGAAVTGKTATAPLDRLKILIQTQHKGFENVGVFKSNQNGVISATKRIIQADGVKGLFRGNVPAIIRNSLHGGFGFLIHDNLQAYFIQQKNKDSRKFSVNSIHSVKNQAISTNRIFQNFFIGACSGIFSTIITFPVDTIRVMMATNQGNLKQLVKTTSMKRAYSGITSGIVGVAFYAGLLFGSRDIICDILLADERSRKNWFDENLQPKTSTNITMGFVSGLITQFMIYPIDVVKRRRQNNADLSYKAILQSFRTDRQTVFRGFSLNIIRLPVCNAIVWYVRELGYKYFNKHKL